MVERATSALSGTIDGSMNPIDADTGVRLIAIEPSQRLVVLARTLATNSEQAERALDKEAIAWRQLGSTCLGRGLYRHGSIFRGQSDAAVWSHVEFTYFLGATWNQIHLSEVVAEGFRGFGEELDAALRETVPDGRFADIFVGLNDMRTIPRWTLNVPVFEDDAGVGEWACSHQ